MTLRLRFWLLAMDVVEALHLPRAAYYWTLRRASDATDWGEGAVLGEGEPF